MVRQWSSVDEHASELIDTALTWWKKKQNCSTTDYLKVQVENAINVHQNILVSAREAKKVDSTEESKGSYVISRGEDHVH